jgi:hypothetical protein
MKRMKANNNMNITHVMQPYDHARKKKITTAHGVQTSMETS